MDYNELLKDRSFNSPEEICDWMDKAQKAIFDLLIENQSLRNAANGFKNRLKKAEKERDEAVKTLETIMGSQKFCVLCGNVECKNSNTHDATCKPKWNGIKGE